MSIQRRLVDDEEHTTIASREAIHVYDISLTSLEGECAVNSEGKKFVDVPHIWMTAIDPFSILERAILAEHEDPRPICGKSIHWASDTSGAYMSHCIRDWHHIGECAGTVD